MTASPHIQVISKFIIRNLRAALTVNLISSIGLLLTFFLTTERLPFAVGCILAQYASDRKLKDLHRFADTILDVLSRVVYEPAEHGDVIGTCYGLPIHAWVSVERGGARYSFAGKPSGMEFPTDQICVLPGLIYQRGGA